MKYRRRTRGDEKCIKHFSRSHFGNLLKNIGREDMNWIHLAQDRVQWWSVMKTVIKQWDSLKGISFSDQLLKRESAPLAQLMLHRAWLFSHCAFNLFIPFNPYISFSIRDIHTFIHSCRGLTLLLLRSYVTLMSLLSWIMNHHLSSYASDQSFHSLEACTHYDLIHWGSL
jgi:hypothetical protein